MTQTEPITVTTETDAPALWVIRDRMRFMGNLADSDLALVDLEVPPGSGTPPHRHASPETFRVIEGEITFGNFDGEAPSFIVAGSGTVVRVPSMAAHNYQNTGQTPARMLVVLEPSMIRFFHELGTDAIPPDGPPSEEEIGQVIACCTRHGIEILGGPPV